MYNSSTCDYVKHLVECDCILPQFQSKIPIIFHKFTVFSRLDPNTGEFIPHFAECNNCGAIHKVTEVFESTRVNKETSPLLPKIEEIKLALPERLVKTLDSLKITEVHVWQEVQYLIEEKKMGKVILSREVSDDKKTMIFKVLLVLGENLFKVDTLEEEI